MWHVGKNAQNRPDQEPWCIHHAEVRPPLSYVWLSSPTEGSTDDLNPDFNHWTINQAFGKAVLKGRAILKSDLFVVKEEGISQTFGECYFVNLVIQ